MSEMTEEVASTSPLPEPGVERGLARSRAAAILCLVVMVAAGWIYLGFALVTHMQSDPGSGTGLDFLPHGQRFDAFARALAEALCRPHFGRLAISADGGFVDIAVVFVMWVAMTLAMMLPTAGPMILTYADIADSAAKKGAAVISPRVLIAGYLSVWLGFALAVTSLQFVLTRAALLDPAMGTASPLFSGAVFLAAGAYQFSQLKHACVTRCQRPFPFFLTHWSTRARGVFRLGLTQGVYCLGCCWLMMLVMFAVGVMNVVWMAAVGLIMAGEKIGTTTRFSRLVGGAFALVGAGFVVASIAARWPAGFPQFHFV